ncbi:MAG: tRNA (guanosine(37)-N1)-methyltransferase TrmD [Planctomycetes bacterium]|jgi:tRNA (guanine37-N1)-methyltransferase|nr:tRNA (guanosine(37)-N1)-methyltransferase TrmD [Planctomycetota bacterium]
MALRIDILTLFPELFEAFRTTSIVGRAASSGLVEIHVTNIRDFATDRYGSVDDTPFGGGPGMVLKCEPVFAAVEHVRNQDARPGTVIMMTPQGRPLRQDLAGELTTEQRLILLAGHYEGFDERIREHLVDMEISLGDFVLSGGEIAAMAVIDAVVRLLPGALGKDESIHEESFQQRLLEYPHYTRPREFRGWAVPEILLSGDHGRIAAWRAEQARQRTRTRRPDLLHEPDNHDPTNDTD